MNRVTLIGVVLTLSLAAMLLVGCGGDGGGGATNTTGGNTNTTPPLSPTEFVYVGNEQGNTVSQYQIARDGTLAPLSPATVSTGSNPGTLTSDPKGRFLYVANSGDGTISQYQIGGGGVLTPLSPATVAAGAGSGGGSIDTIVVDASGRFLYLLNTTDANVRLYTIGSGGALTFQSVLSNIPASTSLTTKPQGEALYALSSDNSTLAQFKINADGTVTPFSTATVTVPSNPTFLSVTPDGKFAYVSFDSAAMPAQYRVNADGSLTLLNQGSLASGSGTLAAPNVDPDFRFVYCIGVGDSGAAILQFKIQSNGTLTPLTPPAIQFGATEAIYLTFDPSDQFAYIPNPIADAILGFRIGSDGSLSDLTIPAVVTGKLPLQAQSVQRSARRRGIGAGRGAMVCIHR